MNERDGGYPSLFSHETASVEPVPQRASGDNHQPVFSDLPNGDATPS